MPRFRTRGGLVMVNFANLIEIDWYDGFRGPCDK